MTRVNRNNNFTIRFADIGNTLYLRWFLATRCCEKIDHKAVAILRRWVKQKALYFSLLVKVKNHPQSVFVGLSIADAGNNTGMLVIKFKWNIN